MNIVMPSQMIYTSLPLFILVIKYLFIKQSRLKSRIFVAVYAYRM